MRHLVANRAARNPNRWYVDPRRVPAAQRPRFDGAFVQLRRPWMDAGWGVEWEPCYDWHQSGNWWTAYHHNDHCFRFVRRGEQQFQLLISWRGGPDLHGNRGRPALRAYTLNEQSSGGRVDLGCRTVVFFDDPAHGLERIGELLDETHGPDAAPDCLPP